MQITWHIDESHPQMLALTIEGVFYGKWKQKWAQRIKAGLNSPAFPKEVHELKRALERLEEELGWKEALNLLSRRACFSSEIRRRLTDAGCSISIVDSVIEKCCIAGYLNDEERARRMMEIWSKKGYGPMRIRLELKKRAISAPLSIENKESHGLYLTRYIDKHLPSQPTREQKAKVIRALLRRGFSLDAVYSAMACKR